MRTEGGEALQVELAFVTPEVFRLRAWLDEEPGRDSPMLVEGAHRRHAVPVSEDDGALVVDSGALRVRLARSRWAMTVEDAAGRVLIDPSQDNTLLRVPFVLPLGFSRDADGRTAFHESFGADAGRADATAWASSSGRSTSAASGWSPGRATRRAGWRPRSAT